MTAALGDELACRRVRLWCLSASTGILILIAMRPLFTRWWRRMAACCSCTFITTIPTVKFRKQGRHVGHHCSGVFGLVGLSASDAVFSTVEGYAALVRSEPEDEHAIRRPNRLDRPPRTIL
jgi:hypothetical protein